MLLLVVLLGFVCAALSGGDSDRATFEKFKRTYGRRYSSADAEERAFEAFRRNQIIISVLNAESEHPSFGVNAFSDISPEDFRKERLMHRQNFAEFEAIRAAREITEADLTIPAEEVPDHWDWRDHGAVTPVKNQESCGSCWAFSTTGNVEGQWALAGNKITSLSEEQLVECDHNLDCACLGGMPFRAFEWLIKNRQGKIMKDAAYPYCVPPHGNCYPCVYNETWCGELSYCNVTCHDSALTEQDVGAVIYDWKAVSKDENIIKQYTFEHGPLSILIDASMLQYYSGGVWAPLLCSKTSFDHAVLIVGYGVHKDWVGITTPYWLVKNSWGEKFGEKGYFMLKRGDNTCGVAGHVVNALVKKKD